MQEMERDAIDFGTLGMPKLFRKIFFPTLFGMLSMSFVTAADGIIIGNGVGSDGIAAVNICIPIIMFFFGLGLMAGVGCSVVSSVHLARRRQKVARLNVSQALWFILAMSVFATVFVLLFPEFTARLLGSSDVLLPQVVDYLLGFMPALVFQMLVCVGLFVVRLDGSPHYAMCCSMTLAFVNLLLDWVFVFPLQMGVFGAAVATSLASVVAGAMVVFYLFFKAEKLKPCRIKRSRKSLLLSLRNIGYQCKVGSSALLGEAAVALLMYVGNLTFLQYLGEAGVGAFGIACYYLPFVFMMGNAVAQSAQPIISYNYGLRRHDRVREAFRISLYTAVSAGVIVMAAFVAFPQLLVDIFIPSTDAASPIAVGGFPYFSVGFVFFVANITYIGYCQSMERMLRATFFAFCRGLIFLLPAFYFMPVWFGESGIWLAMSVSECCTTVAILLFGAFRRKNAFRVVNN